MTKREQKLERLARANYLIQTIASCGRRFFSMGSDSRTECFRTVSRLELDDRGRCWLIDKYTGRRIYTHYTGRWRGFSDGGTLKGVIVALRDYVVHGKLVPPLMFGPWPKMFCDGDPWGYDGDTAIVRATAERLGMLKPTTNAHLFYVQDTRSFSGNCVIWWRPDGKGYTTDLSDAGLYTAERVARMRPTDKPWPRDLIDGLARPRVDMQALPHEVAA